MSLMPLSLTWHLQSSYIPTTMTSHHSDFSKNIFLAVVLISYLPWYIDCMNWGNWSTINVIVLLLKQLDVTVSSILSFFWRTFLWNYLSLSWFLATKMIKRFKCKLPLSSYLFLITFLSLSCGLTKAFSFYFNPNKPCVLVGISLCLG